MFLNLILWAALAGFLWFGITAAWKSNKFAKWLIVLLALPILVFVGLLLSSMVFAGESCGTTNIVNGKPVYKDVPCSSIETPIACVREWTDENGSWNSEERPCLPGEQKTVQQLQREEVAIQKKQCGKNYKAIRIGMSLDLFESCTDGLIFISETVTESGVVEKYRSTFYIIQAKDDRIIAYSRRRN